MAASLKVLLVYLFSINVVTFCVYGWDKISAKRNAWRVPEHTLLLLAAVGGSIGAQVAMWFFRHKTLHLKFKFGVPLILLLQLAAVAWLIWG